MSPWQVLQEFHRTPCRSQVQELRALRGLAALLALLASCHSSWVALLLDSNEVVQGSTGSGTVLYKYIKICILSFTNHFQPHQVWSWQAQDHRLPCFAGTWGMTFLSTHSSRRGLVVAHQQKKATEWFGVCSATGFSEDVVMIFNFGSNCHSRSFAS